MSVTRQMAERLWEELGGDLCICQRPEIVHWCEGCQSRINKIEATLRGVYESYIQETGSRDRQGVEGRSRNVASDTSIAGGVGLVGGASEPMAVETLTNPARLVAELRVEGDRYAAIAASHHDTRGVAPTDSNKMSKLLRAAAAEVERLRGELRE